MTKHARPTEVDPIAYRNLMRTRYGTSCPNRNGTPYRAHYVALKGGPFDGQKVSMFDEQSGTLTVRVGEQVGRYVFKCLRYQYGGGAAVGYLQWEAQP